MVLSELRKIYRISMQKLADSIGVSKQLIGQIEKGTRTISDDVLIKLVDYFNLDSSITSDYRKFFMKNSLDEIQTLKIKKAKIEKEAEVIEIEETDPYTGDTYISKYNTLDIDGLIVMEYGIRKKEFVNKIEKRLEDVIDKTAEEYGQFTTTQYALSSAFEKIDFYETMIDLDAKVDPYIFQSIIKAVSNSTKSKKTMGTSPFIRKLTKVIQEEMDRKEKERQKAIDDWNEIYND